MDVKNLNYKAYAERLYKAVDGIGTDEVGVYRVAKEMRQEIAKGVKTVDEQNALMNQATRFLDEAFQKVSKEKGEASALRATLVDEMSGAELTMAEQLFGLREYHAEIEDNTGWYVAGLVGSSGLWIGGFLIVAYAISLAGGLAMMLVGTSGTGVSLERMTSEYEAQWYAKNWDPEKIQENPSAVAEMPQPTTRTTIYYASPTYYYGPHTHCHYDPFHGWYHPVYWPHWHGHSHQHHRHGQHHA